MPEIDIKSLLAAGKKAQVIQYGQFLTRVRAGETLSLTEQKVFDYLHERLKSSEEKKTRTKSGRSFSTIRAVSDYLTEQGFRATKSTVDNHVRAGKLERDKNGTFSLEAVERYATKLHRLDGTPHDPVVAQAQKEKLDLELRRERADTELAELKLEARKKDLITGPLEQELAARLIIFKSDIENFAYSRAAALIASVDGDQAKAPELIALFLAAAETWLARYAHGREFYIDARGTIEPAFESHGDESRSPAPDQEEDQ